VINGWLLLDKPPSLSSASCLAKIKYQLLDQLRVTNPDLTKKSVKIGHCGTLDPLATGVLICLLGSATKLADVIVHETKKYDVTVLLGYRSLSHDIDSQLTASDSLLPELEQIQAVLKNFSGRQKQIPPTISAIQEAGARSYARARRGEIFELAAREIEISEIALNSYNSPRLDLTVSCSKGTYVRALARDLGECLGCGAVIEKLRRTETGKFNLSQGIEIGSVNLDQIRPISELINCYPQNEITDEEFIRLRSGDPKVRNLLFSLHNNLATQIVTVFNLNNEAVAAVISGKREPRIIFI
jgi:tRNA pseudouridine55 synthase